MNLQSGVMKSVRPLLLIVTLVFATALSISMCGPTGQPAELNLRQPIFVKNGALICNELSWYTPGNMKYCGEIGGQRVVVMQVGNEGRMMKVSPYKLAPYFEGAAGWVHRTDLHN